MYCVQLFYSVFNVRPKSFIEVFRCISSLPLFGVKYVEVRVNLRQAIRSDGRKSIGGLPYSVKQFCLPVENRQPPDD